MSPCGEMPCACSVQALFTLCVPHPDPINHDVDVLGGIPNCSVFPFVKPLHKKKTLLIQKKNKLNKLFALRSSLFEIEYPFAW